MKKEEMKNEKRKYLSHFALCAFLFSLIVFARCASKARFELYENSSVGDSYSCTISPEGVVRQVSSRYVPSFGAILLLAGVGGKSVWTFEAIAEGEAEIVVYNHFRGGSPRRVVTYKAVVDNKKKLMLTEWQRHGDGRPAPGEREATRREIPNSFPYWVKSTIGDVPEDALIGVGKAKLDTVLQSRDAAQTGARESISRQMNSIVVRDLLYDYRVSSDADIENIIAFGENITATLFADKFAGFRILDENTDDDGAVWVVLMLSKAEAMHIIDQAVAAAKLAVPAMASFNILEYYHIINEAFEKIYYQQVRVVEVTQ